MLVVCVTVLGWFSDPPNTTPMCLCVLKDCRGGRTVCSHELFVVLVCVQSVADRAQRDHVTQTRMVRPTHH